MYIGQRVLQMELNVNATYGIRSIFELRVNIGTVLIHEHFIKFGDTLLSGKGKIKHQSIDSKTVDNNLLQSLK